MVNVLLYYRSLKMPQEDGMKNMESINYNLLNRIFSRRMLDSVLENKFNELNINWILDDMRMSHEVCFYEVIKKMYQILNTKYRNEYYYKNVLLNKKLLGRHSLNTTVALSEIPLHRSIADFILINDRATVYEIKTDLDKLDRLSTQISNYYKVFNRVYVVASESHEEKLQSILKNTKVGILVLTNRNTLSERKKAIEDWSNLEHQSMFRVLRKPEYERIILDYYGELPKTQQVYYYRACFELFSKIDLKEAYSYMMAQLKNRNIKCKEAFKKVPTEIKYLVYFSNFNLQKYERLNAFLNTRLGELNNVFSLSQRKAI